MASICKRSKVRHGNPEVPPYPGMTKEDVMSGRNVSGWWILLYRWEGRGAGVCWSIVEGNGSIQLLGKLVCLLDRSDIVEVALSLKYFEVQYSKH